MSSEYLKQVFFQGESRSQAVSRAVDAALSDGPGGVDDEVRDRQVLIRVGEVQRSQWQQCADADGLSVSEWLRQMADARFREVFTCQHPLSDRKSYPWSELCLKCGARLR